MVDSARQLLDELMGRHRNIDPTGPIRELHWADDDFCLYYLVNFCPHDLFVNTKADLGTCKKLHDDQMKQKYEEDDYGPGKRKYEDEFLRFCNNMINEVDRKIQKGRLRLQNSKGDAPPVPHVSKLQDRLNKMNERINKLVSEAEEAGTRGDVDQAQDLMIMCDNLKAEREILMKGSGGGADNPHWSVEVAQSQEKQMEVCEVCGAFLIVGDAQQRIEDHLTGKQHLGYAKLRRAVEDLYDRRKRSNADNSAQLDEPSRRRGGDDRRNQYRDEPDRRNRHDRRDRDNYRSRGGDRYDRNNYRQRNRGDNHSRRRSRSRSPN